MKISTHRVSDNVEPKEGHYESLFRHFCESTTAHGLGSAVKEISHFGKRFWMCIFLIACIINVAHLTLLIDRYFSYPTQDVTSVASRYRTLPDVTICNVMGAPIDDKQRVINRQGTRAGKYAKFLQNLNAINDTSFKVKHTVYPNYFEQMSLDEIDEVGPRFEDFVISCFLLYENCTNPSYFRPVYHQGYNKCYQFSARNVSSSWATVGYSADSGLRLLLYLDTESSVNSTLAYNSKFPQRSSVGAHVSVSSPDTLTSPSEHGWSIMPGHLSSISVVASDIERLGGSYSNCTYQEKIAFYNRSYSQFGCKSEYFQQLLMEKCSCISSYEPIPELLGAIPLCGQINFNNITESADRSECELTTLMEAMRTDAARSSCFPPCKDTTYSSSLSQTLWPSTSCVDDFYHQFITQHPDKYNLKAYKALNKEMTSKATSNERKTELIRRNFVQLTVYYSTDQVQSITQQASYGVPDLMSDIGGTLGLWAGFSIITVLEFVRFLVSICGHAMSKSKK